jgi:hypothetical protein
MIILSKSIDFGLIKFPIVFPLIYLFVLYQFPSYENFLIIFTILFLAETHFGATWPFLFDKKNLEFVKNRKLNLLVLPILIVLISFVSYFTIKNIFLLVFFYVKYVSCY